MIATPSTATATDLLRELHAVGAEDVRLVCPVAGPVSVGWDGGRGHEWAAAGTVEDALRLAIATEYEAARGRAA
jgi:hypothetical protein